MPNKNEPSEFEHFAAKMGDKDSPNWSVTRWICFMSFHFGFIGFLGIFIHQFDGPVDMKSATSLIIASIGMHFFGSVLYQEHTRKD